MSNVARVGKAVIAAAVLAGCGAPSGQMSAAASTNRSADEANVARQTADPRAGDATASPSARPPSSPPATGSAAAPGPELIPRNAAEPPKSAEAPSKIGARHVLVMWMGSERAPESIMRSRAQALAVAEEVHRRARAGDDFARLAVEFSDEPGAGARGGSLGKFGRGQMVPSFEAAAFALDVLEISDIVETPFGFHVIQRTE